MPVVTAPYAAGRQIEEVPGMVSHGGSMLMVRVNGTAVRLK